MPSARTALPSLAVRATRTPRKLAIEVPVTKRPLASCGKPNSSRTQANIYQFDFDRRMVAPAQIGVQSARQHFRQHAGDRSRTPGPTP